MDWRWMMMKEGGCGELVCVCVCERVGCLVNISRAARHYVNMSLPSGAVTTASASVSGGSEFCKSQEIARIYQLSTLVSGTLRTLRKFWGRSINPLYNRKFEI